MESLHSFIENKIENKQLKSINGGANGQDSIISSEFRSLLAEPKTYATGAFLDDDYTPDDYWTDNDGDGEMSPGDIMCHN